jgi:hypothetical protein
MKCKFNVLYLYLAFDLFCTLPSPSNSQNGVQKHAFQKYNKTKNTKNKKQKTKKILKAYLCVFSRVLLFSLGQLLFSPPLFLMEVLGRLPGLLLQVISAPLANAPFASKTKIINGKTFLLPL